jgi:hypothetical protein
MNLLCKSWPLGTKLLVGTAAIVLAAGALAAAVESFQIYESRKLFEAHANYYGQKEDELRAAIAEGREAGPTCKNVHVPQTDLSPVRRAEMQQLADHYAALRHKYQIASSQPWRRIPPDTPQP